MGRYWWPAWHSLYGGPKDIFGLAEHLGVPHPYEYLLLYRSWSEAAHATNVTFQFGNGVDGLRALRTPVHFSSSVTFAIDFLVRGMRAVLTHYGMRERIDDLNVWAPHLDQQLEYLSTNIPDR